MKQLIELNINGESYELVVTHQTTLVEVLREFLGMTGTKAACGTGECGACTVLVNRKPILSCLTLAMECEGQEIVSIEGLSQGRQLTPVQQMFQKFGAVQCGFCTPGMILSTTALLEENSNPSDEEIMKALEGNLCRCTGYNKIIEAVHKAADIRISEGN